MKSAPDPSAPAAPGDSRTAAKAAVLSATGLGMAFEPGRPLFSGLSVEIPAGITLVRGGDGRGKSTLMRLLAGALPAGQGTLQIDGIGLKDDPAGYRRQVFWTEARNDAFDEMTPPAFFDTVRGRHAAFDAALLGHLIDALGLEPHLPKQLFMLSTGSKRKVWAAAALASKARVTLIDEPFAALDAPSVHGLLQSLQAEAAAGDRAFVIADYEPPEGLALTGLIDLGD